MHAADYAVLISVLSLLASVLSVIVAFVAVTRDRHVVAAKSEAWNNGRNWVLTVTVVNAGKRPISIEFLSVTVPDMPTRKRDFFRPEIIVSMLETLDRPM